MMYELGTVMLTLIVLVFLTCVIVSTVFYIFCIKLIIIELKDKKKEQDKTE